MAPIFHPWWIHTIAMWASGLLIGGGIYFFPTLHLGLTLQLFGPIYYGRSEGITDLSLKRTCVVFLTFGTLSLSWEQIQASWLEDETIWEAGMSHPSQHPRCARAQQPSTPHREDRQWTDMNEGPAQISKTPQWAWRPMRNEKWLIFCITSMEVFCYEMIANWRISGRNEWKINKDLLYSMGFSGGSDGKESACNVGDLGSIRGLSRSPREGNGKLL